MLSSEPHPYDDYTSALLAWTERLIGISAERVGAAVSKVRELGCRPVERALLNQPTIDSALAAVRLIEGLDLLEAQGVPREKMLGKLRRDQSFWATWAELRAAVLLVTSVPDTSIEYEPTCTTGKRPDFRLRNSLLGEIEVEFKAVGLSDAEEAFCCRMAPNLPRLLPATGHVVFHADAALESFPRSLPPQRELDVSGADCARSLPGFPDGLTGATICAHNSEFKYAKRAWSRLLTEACLQLSPGKNGWPSLYWSNGASIDQLVSIVDWDALPANVQGIILLGDAVAIPIAQVHSFRNLLPRGLEPNSRRITRSDTTETHLVDTVLDAFDNATGVRATLLVATDEAVPRVLLNRDGNRRYQPFNLLVGPEHGFERDSQRVARLRP